VVVTGSPQAEVTFGMATIGSNGIYNGGMVSVSGNIVTIPLTNVTNLQTINIRLNGVNGADAPAIGVTIPMSLLFGDLNINEDVTIPMSVLIGDVNANGVVNASDIASTKAQLGQSVSGDNFRKDVNANGFINATDVSLVKAAIGTALP